MYSITSSVAKALAYRWGELQEEPPEFIDELMIDLTRALAESQQAGDEEQAKCLGEVLDALAEGIVKYENPAGPELDGETLRRSVVELRTYYYLKAAQRKGGQREKEAVERVLPEERLKP